MGKRYYTSQVRRHRYACCTVRTAVKVYSLSLGPFGGWPVRVRLICRAFTCFCQFPFGCGLCFYLSALPVFLKDFWCIFKMGLGFPCAVFRSIALPLDIVLFFPFTLFSKLLLFFQSYYSFFKVMGLVAGNFGTLLLVTL